MFVCQKNKMVWISQVNVSDIIFWILFWTSNKLFRFVMCLRLQVGLLFSLHKTLLGPKLAQPKQLAQTTSLCGTEYNILDNQYQKLGRNTTLCVPFSLTRSQLSCQFLLFQQKNSSKCLGGSANSGFEKKNTHTILQKWHIRLNDCIVLTQQIMAIISNENIYQHPLYCLC